MVVSRVTHASVGGIAADAADVDPIAMTEPNTKPHFATLAHGKLKHRTDVVAARMHNNRDMACENVDKGGPAPEVIFGPEDTWAGVKSRLAELDIKPRKGAVHALELVMGASEKWWIEGEKPNRLQMMAYERQVWVYLRDRFTKEAIISLTWHLDETTPHLHVIVLPIRRRIDGRFKDGRERWSLSARGDLSRSETRADGTKVTHEAGEWRGGMGGIQHMEREQSHFAKVMKPLKLVRGKEKSRADDGKSTREYRLQLKALVAATGIEREDLARQRVDVAAEAERQIKVAEQIDADRMEQGAEWGKLVQEELALERLRRDTSDELEGGRASLQAERASLQRERGDVSAEAARQRDETAAIKRLREEMEAERAVSIASIAEHLAALAAHRDRIDTDKRTVDARLVKERDWIEKRQKAEDNIAKRTDALRAGEANVKRREAALDDQVERMAELADTCARAMATVDPSQLPAVHRKQFFAAANDLGLSIKRAGERHYAIRTAGGVSAGRSTWKGFEAGA